jgi:hypothetical protein
LVARVNDKNVDLETGCLTIPIAQLTLTFTRDFKRCASKVDIPIKSNATHKLAPFLENLGPCRNNLAARLGFGQIFPGDERMI